MFIQTIKTGYAFLFNENKKLIYVWRVKFLKADDGHQRVVDDVIVVDDVVRSDDVPDAVAVSEVGVRVVGAHQLHPALVHVQARTVAAW